MGLGEILGGIFKGNPASKKGPKQKCPNCESIVFINEERCSKCGVHIKSMFRRKCPKCATLNELGSKNCSKCKYDFEAELERAKETEFVCPICGYKSESLLTRCPSCNTKFI
ncbi:hypothetical protein HZC08_00770 [Candidatus Micrarchaeota archaeon]|nr:hypothetical protein [Candidatus Micrarchaeota archaeon]